MYIYYLMYVCIRYSWHFLTLTAYSSKLPALAGLGFFVPQNGGETPRVFPPFFGYVKTLGYEIPENPNIVLDAYEIPWNPMKSPWNHHETL